MTQPSILIVIVNWNSGPQLEHCLTSVSQVNFPGSVSVVVVDNASSDGSETCVERLAAAGHCMTLVRAGGNLGFGKGCNLGVKHFLDAGGVVDFVLFLNPDTVLEPDTLTRLCAAPQIQDPETAIFGVQLLDAAGVTHSCSNFPTALNFWCKITGLSRVLPRQGWAQHHMSGFNHLNSRTVDQVMGAFLMIRWHVFQKLNGFDPQFFVYFEEVDLCLRARKDGYRTWFEASSKAWHRGGGTTEAVKGFRLYLSLSSRLRYFRKNHATWEYIAIWMLSFGIEPVARATHLALWGRFGEFRDLIECYGHFVRQGIR